MEIEKFKPPARWTNVHKMSRHISRDTEGIIRRIDGAPSVSLIINPEICKLQTRGNTRADGGKQGLLHAERLTFLGMMEALLDPLIDSLDT